MKTRFFLLTLLAALTLRAQASSEAMLSYVGSTSESFSPTYSVQAGPVGWTFTPQTDISVTALGAFSYCLPGSGLEVGLWNSSGVLLASNTITSGSTAVGQSLYEIVAPVALTAGQTYYLGAYSPAGSFTCVAVDPDDGTAAGYATMTADIQLDNVAYEQGSGFVFPDITADQPGSAIVAPNFEFAPVPEPSSLGLLGAAALLALRRRIAAGASTPG